MSPEEIERLTEKIKLFLSMKGGKLVKNPSIEQTEKKSEPKLKPIVISSVENQIDDRNKGNISSIFCDTSVIMPNRMSVLTDNLNETNYSANTRNVACQTDELSKGILKKIELQEREIQLKNK